MAGIQIDGVNNKIDFDDDADTSISSATDDTLVVEVGGNTLATVTSTGVAINDGTTITPDDNSDTLKLVSTDADANSGPVLVLHRDGASPADDDQIGIINFAADSDAASETDFAIIKAFTPDVSHGSETGQLTISTRLAGSEKQRITLGSGATIFNDDSADYDFRVESDSQTHMLYVDGGSNYVSINTSSNLGAIFNIGDSAGTLQLSAETSAAGAICFAVKNTNASQSSRISTFQSQRNSTAHFEFSRFLSNDGSDVEMLFDGAGDIKIDGGVATGGVDYAEFFEWKDGNSSDEDRRGHSVITDGNKIVVATSSDDATKIIGIVSTTPTIIGDADVERWMFKYERDEYGSLIWEEHTVTEWTEEATNEDEEDKKHSYDTDRIPEGLTPPSDAVIISEEEDRYGNTIKLKRKKLNPEWDPNRQYISRKDRKEWEAIGLVGKLRLKKGEPVNPNWIKLRDISDSVEEWLVR